MSNPFVTYFEASVDSLDLLQRIATCTSAVAYEDGRRPTFQVKREYTAWSPLHAKPVSPGHCPALRIQHNSSCTVYPAPRIWNPHSAPHKSHTATSTFMSVLVACMLVSCMWRDIKQQHLPCRVIKFCTAHISHHAL